MDHRPSSHRLTVPLNALRAFEAAARHLSVKDAAAELVEDQFDLVVDEMADRVVSEVIERLVGEEAAQAQ